MSAKAKHGKTGNIYPVPLHLSFQVKTLRGKLLWLVPTALLVTLALGRLSAFQVGAYHDDAWYIDTATALARGQGFVRPWTGNLMPETFLPVGYPVLLAPLRWLFPDTFLPLQLLSVVASVGTVLLCDVYYHRRVSLSWAWLTTLLLAVNVSFVTFSTLVMAEAVYMFLVMLVMVIVEREDNTQHSFKRDVIIGVIGTLAYLVRSWGITLIIALVLLYVLQRHWRGLLAVLLPFGLVYVSWSLRNKAMGGEGASYGLGLSSLASYIPWLPQSTSIAVSQPLAENIPATLRQQVLVNLPESVIPMLFGPQILKTLDGFRLGWAPFVLSALVLIIILIGYTRHLFRKITLAEVYMPIYLVLLAVAPLEPRYLLPLIPFVLLYLVSGFLALTSLLRRGIGANQGKRTPFVQCSLAAILTALVLVHALRDLQGVVQPIKSQIPDITVAPLWLTVHTPPDAIVMAQVPRVSFLYSRRETVAFPDTGSEVYRAYSGLAATNPRERFCEALRLSRATYVVIEPELRSGKPFTLSANLRDDILPLLEEYPGSYELVFSETASLVRIYYVRNPHC